MATIRERPRRNGTVSYAVLWREKGSGKQTSMTFPTFDGADTVRRLLNANGQSFQVVERLLAEAASKAPTVREMLERHIDLLTGPHEGTIEGYQSIVEHHFAVGLGELRVDTVTEEDVARWLKDELAAGATRKSIANRIGLLSSAFKTAIRKGWCSRNPCEGVRLPDDQRPGRRATFLTTDEWELLYRHVPERFQLLVKTLAGTGMRFGEATALTWDDLRLDADVPYIVVDKAWRKLSGGRYEVRSPKSATSIRDVSISPSLADELRAVKRAGDLVFRGGTGGRLGDSRFHEQGWRPAVSAARAAGLRKAPRPHDLRHSHASWLLMEGVPIFVVSRRLGHASVDITTRVYGHITPKSQRDAAAAIARVLG